VALLCRDTVKQNRKLFRSLSVEELENQHSFELEKSWKIIHIIIIYFSR
jgi:hypothetical protein